MRPTTVSAGPGSRIRTRGAIEEAYLVEAERFRRSSPDLLAWAGAFRLENGVPLDFETFPFQVELYSSFGNPELETVTVQKAAQCGISALGVSLTLFAADVWGANVVYVLPGFDDAFDFSDTRVAPAITDSAYLERRVRGTDNKGLKKLGDAALYFRGSGSEKKALSIPADLLVLDEYDRLDQRNVPKFRRRLSSPTSMALERRFSNPSFPEIGIHKLYLSSDRREWLVTCPSCHLEAPLGWAGDGHRVDEELAERVCGGCSRALSRDAVASGRWVPERPGGPRGYHISKLIVPDQDIGVLVAEHNKTAEEEVQAHYNFDLGLPYSPKGGSLSRELVLACRRGVRLQNSYDGPDWVTAGVDVGRVLHVRVSRWLDSGRAAPLWLGTVPDFEELAQLWARYDVRLGLIDERPEERAARAFCEAHPGRALLVRWAGDEQRDPLVLDKDRDLVVARRTGACDRLVAAVGGQLKLLPAELPTDYISHLTAPIRITETSSRGQKVARYVSERDDDYFMAEAYDLLAREIRGGPAAGGTAPPAQVVRRRR